MQTLLSTARGRAKFRLGSPSQWKVKSARRRTFRSSTFPSSGDSISPLDCRKCSCLGIFPPSGDPALRVQRPVAKNLQSFAEPATMFLDHRQIQDTPVYVPQRWVRCLHGQLTYYCCDVQTAHEKTMTIRWFTQERATYCMLFGHDISSPKFKL